MCVSFSALPKVGKLVEDAAFSEYFNYKPTLPFSRAELTTRAELIDHRKEG